MNAKQKLILSEVFYGIGFLFYGSKLFDFYLNMVDTSIPEKIIERTTIVSIFFFFSAYLLDLEYETTRSTMFNKRIPFFKVFRSVYFVSFVVTAAVFSFVLIDNANLSNAILNPCNFYMVLISDMFKHFRVMMFKPKYQNVEFKRF